MVRSPERQFGFVGFWLVNFGNVEFRPKEVSKVALGQGPYRPDKYKSCKAGDLPRHRDRSARGPRR